MPCCVELTAAGGVIESAFLFHAGFILNFLKPSPPAHEQAFFRENDFREMTRFLKEPKVSPVVCLQSRSGVRRITDFLTLRPILALFDHFEA